MNWLSLSSVFAIAAISASCGNSILDGQFLPKSLTMDGAQEKADQEARKSGIPGVMGSGFGDLGGSGIRPTVTFTKEDIPDEDEIVWAPEDPNVAFDPELEEKWESTAHKLDGNWQRSLALAVRESRVTGKPIMVWFADSRGASLSNRLSDELFSRADFRKWAKEHYVRLMVDKAVDADDDDDVRHRKKEYSDKLRKRFKVIGAPEVLVLSPAGDVFARYRGYRKGQSEFYWGRLKNAHRAAQANYGKWRNKMEKKGYRVWQSDKGVQIFARMYRYKDNVAYFVETDGRKSKLSLGRLSGPDQKWIHDQLALRKAVTP